MNPLVVLFRGWFEVINWGRRGKLAPPIKTPPRYLRLGTQLTRPCQVAEQLKQPPN